MAAQDSPKTLRERLDEHFGLTVATVLFVAVATTAGVTWNIAKDVLLERKNNEISDLKRELASRPAATPVNPKDPIPAPSIQLQVSPSAASTTPPPPTSSSQSTRAATPTPTSPPDDETWIGGSTHPRTVGPTLDSLKKQWQAIVGRFAEEAAFLERIDNAQVSWTVAVSDVVYSGGDIVTVFYTSPDATGLPLGGVSQFRAQLKDRLLALNRGDVITVDGILRTSGKGIILFGKDFKFLHAASPTPPP
jgi:hypothetical protein